jgi:hypothetical protein
MGLPTKIIALETLMKKWRMSFHDIFLIFLNQDLRPVYGDETEWRYFGEDEDHDPIELFWRNHKKHPILFLRSDVEKLERKQGGNVTVSPDVISEEAILKRWDITRTELWNAVGECKLDVVDPLGARIKDFDNLVNRHLIAYPDFNVQEIDLYFRLA